MTTTRNRPAQGVFCWMEHASRDRDAAKAFYGSVFGWTFEDHPMPGDTGRTYTMIRQAGEDVGGMYAMEGPMFEGVPAHWMSYIQVEDVDAAAARAREAGGRLGYEPMDVPGVGRLCLVVDPTGARVSFWKGCEGGPAPVESGDVPVPGRFCWYELITRDLPAARDFWGRVIGWEFAEQDMGGFTYVVLKTGGRDVGGMMAMDENWPAEVPSHWMYYIAVEDVDAACKAVEAAGGSVCVPPTDIPVGRFAVVGDNTGATFSVLRLNTAC